VQQSLSRPQSQLHLGASVPLAFACSLFRIYRALLGKAALETAASVADMAMAVSAAPARLSFPLDSSSSPSAYTAFSSSSPLLDSSSGSAPDAPTADSSSYPGVFLLGIFLPSLAVALLILYLHWSMRRYGVIRCPDSCFALFRRRQQDEQKAAAATREAAAAAGRRLHAPLLADSIL
jgi:hypothetical protein